MIVPPRAESKFRRQVFPRRRPPTPHPPNSKLLRVVGVQFFVSTVCLAVLVLWVSRFLFRPSVWRSFLQHCVVGGVGGAGWGGTSIPLGVVGVQGQGQAYAYNVGGQRSEEDDLGGASLGRA